MGRRGKGNRRGTPVDNPASPGETDRGGSIGNRPLYATIQDYVKGVDGTISATYPFIDPINPARNQTLQFESLNISPANVCASANAPLQSLVQVGNAYTAMYQLLVDNIARKFENAQLLNLSTVSNWSVYMQKWLEAASILYTLISLLNADGFNESHTAIAEAGSNRRGRLQTDYDDLQTYPVPPGFVDLVRRCCGVFATRPGSGTMFHYANLVGTGNPLNLITGGNWDNLLNEAEAAMNAINTGGTDFGSIRIVLAEYFGDPIDLPFDGVKIGGGGYEQFALSAGQFLDVTNVFAWPAVEQAATVANFDGTVEVLVPRGCENDPLWMSLYRVWPFNCFNNVAKALAMPVGLFSGIAAFNSIQRAYNADGTTGLNATTVPAANYAYFDQRAPLWYAAQTYNKETNPQLDFRPPNEYIRVFTNFSYLAQETSSFQRAIIVGKQRIPLPPGMTMYSVQRVKSRRNSVLGVR